MTLENSRIPIAIQFPAMTSTSVTFQASSDGSTYVPVYDENTLYTVNCTTTGRHVALKRAAFEGVKHVQIVGTSTETALRTLTLISGE